MIGTLSYMFTRNEKIIYRLMHQVCIVEKHGLKYPIAYKKLYKTSNFDGII